MPIFLIIRILWTLVGKIIRLLIIAFKITFKIVVNTSQKNCIPKSC